jgi:hypothetical protein
MIKRVIGQSIICIALFFCQLAFAVQAPELTGDRGWLNTDKPLSIAQLKGKVVLLDFWTYGCINCIHIIPDLKRLEKKYPNELVVIGVHSAKFENEQNSNNIRQMMLRYDIQHPVVNDADFKIWDAYGAQGWPTQVLIDPAGNIVDRVVGEGHYARLDESIAKTIATFRANKQLNEQPLVFAHPIAAPAADAPLAFPSKITVDAQGQRLVIADTHHHRIVITSLNGKILQIIGNGKPGAQDGDFQQAQFQRPQGVAIDGHMIYVADTDNHRLRQIDLRQQRVTTLVPNTTLRSPWDVIKVGQSLYIAMAGSHQIWRLDLATQTASVFAGSGKEARVDGPLMQAAFAQPSGLAFNGQFIYVADTESNIIRQIDLLHGQVTTLVGGDLFKFGDVDGVGDAARLQHPLGITWQNNALWIADTYNHKIKRLDPLTRQLTSIVGATQSGHADGKAASFYEPGGISSADGKLYIADTNNHVIRVVDLQTQQTSTLKITGN